MLVLDDDIIRLFTKPGSKSNPTCSNDTLNDTLISKQFSRILNYIMTEFERNMAAYKEYLPTKSLHSGYPQFLWIQALLHDNFDSTNNALRFKFNRCLEEVCRMHSDCQSLHLKHVWDPKNGSFYLSDSQRFTSDGYAAYWEAVDRTVRYFDSVLLKKRDGPRKKKSSGPDQKDRFKWQNPKFNRISDKSSPRVQDVTKTTS